jgi:cyclase
MQQVSENIYVETGFKGCNTSFIVTSKGVVIIDTPMVPAEAKKWRVEATKHGPLLYVINTEPHHDHAAGNYWIGAEVIAHEGTRRALMTTGKEDLIGSLQRNAPETLPLDPNFHFRLPAITFSQELTIYLGRHTLHLMNTPGHTASETTIHVPEEKVVFTGDNLNLRNPIFIKSLPFEWLKSLDRLEQIDASVFVPGHGEVSGKNCLPGMRMAVQYYIDTVNSALAKGISQEETINLILTEKPFLAQDPWLKNAVRMSVADLFQSLIK